MAHSIVLVPTLVLLTVVAAQHPAQARSDRNPIPVAAGVIASVVDGDTVVLDNGTQVRLTGIQAPKLPLGRANFRAWPLAAASKTALVALTNGRRVRLGYDGRRIDRHGRLLAHLFNDDEMWIQGEMVRRGMARVYTFRDNRARARELIALERRARAERRGIWNHPFYGVRTAAESGRYIDTFQLVAGQVRAAAVVRGRGYLNFGDDWRRDFTVTIAPRHRNLFVRAGLRIEEYAGKRVRVRGWLKRFNGPMIEATHPEQIEVLDE